MDLTSYLKGLPDDEAREAFALKCETTIGHLRNVGYGYRPCNTALAVAIERVTAGAVSRQELRPQDYWRHWPDLKAPKSKLAKAA